MKQSLIRNIAIMVLGMVALLTATAQNLTPEQILDRTESSQVFTSARMEGNVVVTDEWGRRETGFRSFSQGRDRSLVEFTSGESEGQKILRTRGDLYVYFPDAEEVIRLQGSAMSESILDSDVSYEDISGDKTLNERYASMLQGSETIDGRDCWKIQLTARERGAAYPKQEVWVDKEIFIVRFSKLYALSGRLLKENRVTDVLRIGGRIIPSRYVIEDKLREGSRTEMVITRAELDVRLPANTFSLENLSW